jgi:hypothetical protein
MKRKSVSAILGAVVAVALMVPAVLSAQATSLGTVRVGKGVMADGKALPAGSYSLRVSSDAVKKVTGQAAANATWVEFVQGGQVKGRELASVVPSAEVKSVIKGTAPAAGATKVELLKGGEYLRVWANRGGNHYLLHLVVGQ